MKCFPAFAACELTLALLDAGCAPRRVATDPEPPSPPPATGPFVPVQAQPVYDMIRAVKDRDVGLIRTVFSDAVVAGFRAENLSWEDVLELYGNFLRESVGPYDLRQFAFSFVGGDNQGQVVVLYAGDRKGDMEVVRQGGAWKLNER